MKLSTKVAYNTIIQIISKTISVALGLVAIAIITRYLGQFGYGEYTTIITFLSFFGIIADFGLTLVTVQIIAKPGVDEDKALGNLMGLRLVSAVCFLGLAPIIVLFLPYSPLVKQGVLVTSLSFLFIALNQVLVGLFQKKLRLDKVSIAEVLSRIVLLIGVVAAWKLELGMIGILVATVVSSAVNFSLHYLLARPLARIKLYFDFTYWKHILIIAWPIAITTILNLIYLKTDTLLLSVIKRPSEIGIMSEVGLYGAAYKVIDVMIMVPFMFAGIILPILTARWANKDKQSFNLIMQKSFNVMVILALPLVAGTQILGTRIMTLVAGPEFAGSGSILKILIIACAFIYLGVIFAHAVIAIDKQKKIIKAYLLTAVSALLGYIIFIPRFSYYGAAWVTIYSELVIALSSFWIVWKYTRYLPSPTIFLKSGLASAVMLAAIHFICLPADCALWLTLSIAIIVYFVALYAFGGLSKQDIHDILNR